MGAWALSLFCCDYDLDLVRDFDDKCRLPDLEIAAGRQPRSTSDLTGSERQDEHSRIRTAEAAKTDNANLSMFEKLCLGAKTSTSAEPVKTLPINYSMFEKLCSDPSKIRSYLDETDTLTRVFAQYKRDAVKVQRSFLRDPYGPGYQMCMLGACAMTLGARISESDRAAMKKYYRTCGLMRDAVTQIEQALDPDIGYVNGCPWDFGQAISKATSPPKEDQLFPGLCMMNVWSPDHGRQKGEKWLNAKSVLQMIAMCKPNVDDLAQSLASLMFDPYATAKTQISSTMADSNPDKYRVDAQRLVNLYDFHTRSSDTQEQSGRTCDSCGGGSKLLKCGKCQEVYYCNSSCQKKDFPKHKAICPLMVKLKTKSELSFSEELAALSKEVKEMGG